MQEARAVAKSIRRAIAGKVTVPFRYFDKGQMATIGRRRCRSQGVGPHAHDVPPAWLSWLLVHIWYLIGFRNRLVVLITWAWSYFTYRRGARFDHWISNLRRRGASGACARRSGGPTTRRIRGARQLVGSGQRVD